MGLAFETRETTTAGCPTLATSLFLWLGWETKNLGQMRLNIRHLAQNRRPPGPGGRGHIPGQTMPGLPRQQRKGRGLLGLDRKAELLACRQLAAQWFQPLRQQVHQRGIARASAGNDVVHAGHSWPLHLCPNELFVARGNALGSQRRSRGQCIFGPVTVLMARRQKLGRIRAPELLAARGARRLEPEIGIAQRRCQHRRQHRAFGGIGRLAATAGEIMEAAPGGDALVAGAVFVAAYVVEIPMQRRRGKALLRQPLLDGAAVELRP